MQSSQDYYDLLGVSPLASEGEIRQAFRALAKALHPDRHTKRDDSPELEFSEVTEAYETLKDPEKRRAYDESLRHFQKLPVAANSAKPKAFMAGLSIGLVLTLAVIGGKVYWDGGFRQSLAKIQDSLQPKAQRRAAATMRVKFAQAKEQTAATPISNDAAIPARGPVQTELAAKTAAVGGSDVRHAASKDIIAGGADADSIRLTNEAKEENVASQTAPHPAEQTLTVPKRQPSDGNGVAGSASSDSGALKFFFSPRRWAEAGAKAQPTTTGSTFSIEKRFAESRSPSPNASEAVAIRLAPDGFRSGVTPPDDTPAYRDKVAALADAADRAGKPRGLNGGNVQATAAAAPPNSTASPGASAVPAAEGRDFLRHRHDAIPVIIGPFHHEATLYLKPGGGRSEGFTDCPICPEMVVVPEGKFTMGVRYGSEDFKPDASPAHTVEIKKPFAVSKLQISTADMRACIQAGGCRPAPFASLLARPEMPARRVSWVDARAYVAWLSAKTSKRYRLLSEAEWEYLARVGRKNEAEWMQPAGDMRYRRLDSIGYSPFAERFGARESIEGNRWGLINSRYDTLEWVDDCWHRSYDKAPSDGSPWLEAGGGDCSRRVIRGGLSGQGSSDLNPTLRAQDMADIRAPMLGLRVARDISVENRTAYESQ